MTAKTVNYTPEMTQQIVDAYTGGTTVEMIAQMTGKSARSIVAKLSREGVYQSKAKVAGAQVTKKADLVDRLATKLNVAPEVVDSLEKATKETLELLVEALEA